MLKMTLFEIVFISILIAALSLGLSALLVLILNSYFGYQIMQFKGIQVLLTILITEIVLFFSSVTRIRKVVKSAPDENIREV